MAADKGFRQAELATERAHLVLEQFAQRLDQFQMHALRKPADIVMRLDCDRWPTGERHAFDHVGIRRALRQKLRAADFLGFGLEHIDEQFADGLALLLGVFDAMERFEKSVLRLNMNERNIVGIAEQRHDALALAEAKKPVIDEDAGELLADRLMDQHRGDGGIDATGQPADHLALADLAADLVDRLLLERAHGPVAGAAGDLAHEIAEDGGAVRGVHDFEMKLRGVEFARFVGDHGDRRVGRGADRGKSRRRPGDAVAMAHPYRIALTHVPDAVGQWRGFRQFNFGAAEFAMMSALDLAAELLRHRLFAVTDAEHRHAGFINGHWGERRILVEHRRRPAGENDRLRLQGGERVFGLLKRRDLAINLLFAHAPRDQLGDLRAEIDDENLVVGRHGGFYTLIALSASGISGAQALRSSPYDCRRRSRLTKKPSVSVRRGVISSPWSEISAARVKR